jgi:hypothetical protein
VCRQRSIDGLLGTGVRTLHGVREKLSKISLFSRAKFDAGCTKGSAAGLAQINELRRIRVSIASSVFEVSAVCLARAPERSRLRCPPADEAIE